MAQRLKRTGVIAWLICGVACLVALISVGDLFLHHSQSENFLKLIGDAVWFLYPIPFAITAALIVSRQRGNIIGWLLMIPVSLSILSAPINNYLNSITKPPVVPDLALLLMTWFSNWNWLVLILPLLLIPLLFPNGHLLSARWRWVLILAAGICAILLLITTFSKNLASLNADWSVSNPIGFLDDSYIQTIIVFWAAGLMVMTLSSFAALFMRYRRTGSVEREQIKWLLYACGVFAVIYIPGIWINNLSSGDNSTAANLFNLLFGLSILTFPAAIAIAILRYRLWDIDLIIRRTLQYGLLSVLLGLVYFGMAVLLEQGFRTITGQDSPLSVVISTLAIATLFTPLRRRIQAAIDRRFFRQKYNAEQAVAAFAAAARSEVELDALGNNLVIAAREALQPESVSLWLNQKEGNR